VITLEQWAEIRRLHRPDRLPIKAIAPMKGISKNTVRRAGCAPAHRITAHRAAMAALAPICESSLGWHNRIRLPRDHYVRLDTCDYSVDPAVIGRMVDVRADLGQVTVTCEGRLVACHDRSWVAHQRVTDPAHKAAADVMRAALLDGGEVA